MNHLEGTVLKLDRAGLPVALVSWMEAATLVAQNKVQWSLGEPLFHLRGGYSNQGMRSELFIAPIVCVDDRSRIWDRWREQIQVMRPVRAVIFNRDGGLCMYCGTKLSLKSLTIDHIVPKSRGGQDTYTNTTSCCVRCNQQKSNRTPEEAGMVLLAVPYCPNPAARLILSRRRIIADQMDYLASFSNIVEERASSFSIQRQ
jgi:5-methylcytosine-specific restriction endonuclease McrA